MRRSLTDSLDVLTAVAISSTPEISDAVGHVVLHEIAELPSPQIILASRQRPCCVVPLLYKIHPASVCTTEVPQQATAFQVAYCASQACRALTGAHQQIARRTAAIVGHHGSTEPFRPGCVSTHEALVLRGFVFGIPRPRLRGSRAADWIEARQHDTDTDPDPIELRKIRLFVTRGRPACIHVEPTARLDCIAEYATIVSPFDDRGRLYWPPFIPAIPGAVPTALYVTPEAADEAPRWAIADIRRVGHPPLLPFQTVPLPHVVDVASALSLLRHELPSLRPVSHIYLDDHALTDVPQATDAITTLTLLGTSGRDGDSIPEPALDVNLDLMERRIALLSHFNSYPPAPWPSRLDLGTDRATSSSITEDRTDSSASFHSRSIPEDLDNDPAMELPLRNLGATSSTTTAAAGLCISDLPTTTTSTPAMDFAALDSPRPRQCNVVSSHADIATAPVCVFAACGHSQPTQVNVLTTISAADVLSRCTSTFSNMGLLPDAAHWILSQRAHWLHDGRLAAFLTTGWGTLEPDYSTVWIEPGHRWTTPFTIGLPLVAERSHLLTRLALPHIELLVVTVNGVIWDGAARPFFNGDVIQLRSTWHRLGTLPVNALDDRIHGLLAIQCGCDGPTGVRDSSLTPLYRDACYHQFFRQWETAFLERFGPSDVYNNLYLVVHGGIFLRLSLGTRLPPTRADVQAFYDEVLYPTLGYRFIEDAHFSWDDTCVFVARTAFYPSSMWLLLGGFRLDFVELDSNQNLSQLPAPPGRIWFPSETRGNVGIAFLQPIPETGTLPEPHNLDGLHTQPPDTAQEPGSPVSSGELPPGSHAMHSIFGTSSEGFQDDFADLRSSSVLSDGTAQAAADTASSSSSDTHQVGHDGLSLLQHHVGLRRCMHPPKRAQAISGVSDTADTASILHGIPTPLRSSRRPCMPVETTPPAVMPSGARNADSAYTPDILPDATNTVTLHIWRPADTPVKLEIARDSHTGNVTQALRSASTALRAEDLVPVFPLSPDSLHCVSKPPSGHTVLVQPPQPDSMPIAVIVHEGDTAEDVCNRTRHCQHVLLFEQRQWLGTHQGCFTGMRLQLSPCKPFASSKALPTVISLDDAIAWQQPRAQAFGVCHHMLTDLTAAFHLSTLSQDFSTKDALHPAARALVEGLPTWRGAPLQALALYTDGSYCSSPPAATWAVAAFGRDAQGEWYWCGFRYGTLTPQATKEWGSSAFPAEIFALAVAQGIIFAANLANAAIFFDATAAFDVSTCQAKAAQPTAITSAARSLTALNKSAGRMHFSMHTPSHSGNPGNELADSLTKLAYRAPPCGKQQELEQLLSAPELAWLWVLFEKDHALPHLNEHGFAPPQISTCYRSCAQTPAQAARSCNAPATTPQQLQLRCATYNTLSLKSSLQQKALAMLFRHHACSFVGLQETRLADTKLQRFGAFTAYTAPSVDGKDGCQLWVNFSQRIGTSSSGDELFFEANTFLIQHATPSQLLVTGAAGSLRFLFVVAHAPTNQRPRPETQAWWDQLGTAIKHAPRGHMPIFMIDANAHFSGGHWTASADTPENLNATLLQGLASSSSLVLSSTVDKAGQPLTTWVFL